MDVILYSKLMAQKAELDAKPSVDVEVENASDLDITDDDGNVIVRLAGGDVQTKNFDSSATTKMKETTDSDADLYLADASGGVIAQFSDGHIKTKNFDSSNLSSGVMNRTSTQTDGVYAACRWHQPTTSSKQFCVLIGGDTHADSTRFASFIEYLNSVDCLDAGIMLGDIVSNTFDDSAAYYGTEIQAAEKPLLTVMGNHDVRGAGSDTALYGKYGSFIQYADLAEGESVSGKMYYYKDFAAYSIRVIVLMQYDLTFNGELCFGQDQIDWLISTLNSTPSGYGVIICEHTNSSRYMTYNMDTSITSSTWYRSNYAPTVMSGDPVPDIVNAWINGTTLSQTYSYTYDNPAADLTVSADFTERGTGEFITYLGGHWHMNVLGWPTDYTDQMDYHCPATGLAAATQGDMPRRAGTVSEDSFNALAVDRDKKTVKIFQIGAHRTKDAVDREYFQFTYGGGT